MHLHDPEERPRDFKKLFNQRTVGKLQDTVTGVSTAEHVITKVAVDHVQTGEDFIRVEYVGYTAQSSVRVLMCL